MNEEELKIGMYTEDEIFQYMTEQEGGMFGRSMYDAIFDKMHALITETEQLKKDKLILKEQLEKSGKARKKATEYINKPAYFDEEMPSVNALGIENTEKVLDILDIEKER